MNQSIKVSSIPSRSSSPIPLPTLVERTAAELGIRHRLIRPYAPQHNGKVECSHRADQKRFYSCHAFYSLDDFEKMRADSEAL